MAASALSSPAATRIAPGRPVRWGGRAVRRLSTEVSPYHIHSLEVGEAGPPLVFLHGLSGSSLWWRHNAPVFAESYRVLLPDVIGFGRTRCPGRMPNIPEIADVLMRWMDAMGAERIHLVGHSMGGQIAAHLAARHPDRVRCLVLVDAAGVPRPLRPRAMARFAMDLVPPGRWGDPVFLPTIVGDALSAGPRVIIQALGRLLRDDVREVLPAIRAPSLVVWGERDYIIPLRDSEVFHQLIPNARRVILPGAAHNPMVDHPRHFNRVLGTFLRSVDRA